MVIELRAGSVSSIRSEEHTSELQSRPHLVCRLLLEKKKATGHNLAITPGPTPSRLEFCENGIRDFKHFARTYRSVGPGTALVCSSAGIRLKHEKPM